MIINTGMRTDIPAFCSQWLLNRLQAGFVLVRNPYNPQQVITFTTIGYSPARSDIISNLR